MDIDTILEVLRERLKQNKSAAGPQIIRFERVAGSSNQIRCVMTGAELTLVVIQEKGNIYFQGATEGRIISFEEFIGRSE